MVMHTNTEGSLSSGQTEPPLMADFHVVEERLSSSLLGKTELGPELQAGEIWPVALLPVRVRLALQSDGGRKAVWGWGEARRAPQAMGQWTLGEPVGNLQLNCFPCVILTLFCQPQAFSGFLNLTALKKKNKSPYPHLEQRWGRRMCFSFRPPALKPVQGGMVVLEPT